MIQMAEHVEQKEARHNWCVFIDVLSLLGLRFKPVIGRMICRAVKSLARAAPAGRVHAQPAAETADSTSPIACRQISHFQMQPLHRTFVEFPLLLRWRYRAPAHLGCS
jgi:hypothetical protein